MNHDEILANAIRNIKDLPKLGSGATRSVYAVDKNYVIKWDRTRGEEVNVQEYKRYQEALEDGNAEKFAASYAISACGTYLLQERVKDKFFNEVCLPHRYYVEAVNAGLYDLFSDCAGFNFGIRESTGELVIIDYAS